jgi:hypothetical protein
MARIGIFGVSSQSGAAFMADLTAAGHRVYGYARPSDNGRATINAVRNNGGIHVDRPQNSLGEVGHFVPVGQTDIGHDLERLARTSELILFTTPSVYHEDAIRELAPILRKGGRRVPLVLSPSRSMAAPYIWRILGEDYPIISFQTCPYACKVFRPGSVYIKTRKRAWMACVEGRVKKKSAELLSSLFPNIVLSRNPAAASLGNIGAVFHPTAYLLNLPAIRQAKAEGCNFSFYMEGITHNAEVGRVVEEVDQIRLRIADAVGCRVFGLREKPQEGEWTRLMSRVKELEANPLPDLNEHRRLRAKLLRPIDDAVVSAQHWLHYTYGVERIPGESLPAAIGRTPNYQQNSCPQARYADEDVPTGLVPLEALAQRLGIDCGPISRVIDVYSRESGTNARAAGRNLREFDTDYLVRYLLRGAGGRFVPQLERSVRCLAPVS